MQIKIARLASRQNLLGLRLLLLSQRLMMLLQHLLLLQLPMLLPAQLPSIQSPGNIWADSLCGSSAYDFNTSCHNFL